ncbi:uncharacterized protein METZ01_LOCUS325710, partial [marine metagenome]
MSYHWADQKKRESDTLYLSDVYERFLVELGDRLNGLHRVSHGSRYWRITLGPWLTKFVDLMFDRWENIARAVSEYDLEKTIALSGIPDIGPTFDTEEFFSLALTDEWNHLIYCSVLKEQTSIRFIHRDWSPSSDQSNGHQSKSHTVTSSRSQFKLSSKIKSTLLSTYSSLARHFIRNTDSVLFRTYMPRRLELAVQARLYQVPVMHFARSLDRDSVRVPVVPELRVWDWSTASRSEFESFLRRMIPQHLPMV